MKLSWRKKVRIKMDDEFLTSFIKDLLSGSTITWRYRSIFQELTIDIFQTDIAGVRDDILDWLKKRSN